MLAEKGEPISRIDALRGQGVSLLIVVGVYPRALILIAPFSSISELLLT